MPRHYLYRAHIQVIRHYRNWGMPERRGRRLAGAPKSGNENFVSGLSNFWWMLHNHLILLICSFILDKSFVAVCQTSSGFIPEYWWTRRYRRAMISCHGTEVWAFLKPHSVTVRCFTGNLNMRENPDVQKIGLHELIFCTRNLYGSSAEERSGRDDLRVAAGLSRLRDTLAGVYGQSVIPA